MDWNTVKGGDLIGPAVIGHRVWRYRLGPPLRLLSFGLGSSDFWLPDEAYASDKEPNLDGSEMAYGIHAFASLNVLQEWIKDLADMLIYRNIYAPDDPARFDGLVRGTVTLWGVCIDHQRGYRAQYARPASFDEACGEHADIALKRLRRMFVE
jgi:hypothetical protein